MATATGAIAVATFDYMLGQMKEEVGFSVDVGNAVTLVPSIMTLLVVFLAGALGDRIGHKRVMVGGGVAFCSGAIVVLLAPSLAVAIFGRALEGIGGASLAIVSLSLLNNRFTEPKGRAAAFGLYAAIVPALTFISPVIGSLLAQSGGWRLVAAGWLLGGVLAVAACWFLVDPDEPQAKSTELVTPLLAGLALAAVATAASSSHGSPTIAITAVGVAVVSLALLAVAHRRAESPALDLAILHVPGGKGVLIAIVLTNCANVVYWTTLLLEYRYHLTLTGTAVTMMPVELAALLGALFGGFLLARLGAIKAALIALSAGAVVALACLFVVQESPRSLPVAVAALFAFVGMSSTAPLSEHLMSLASKRASGSASALRSAAVAIGVTVGGAIIGLFVFGTFETSLSKSLQGANLTSSESREIAQVLRDGAEVDSTAGTYSIPFEEIDRIVDLNSYEVGRAEADAFTVVGICGFVAKGGAVLALLISGWFAVRRRRTIASAARLT